MKCPKCDYLGFDTGDRCRNCGYDFSLVAPPPAALPDLALRSEEPQSVNPDWLGDLDAMLRTSPAPDGAPALDLHASLAPSSLPGAAATVSAVASPAVATNTAPAASARRAASVTAGPSAPVMLPETPAPSKPDVIAAQPDHGRAPLPAAAAAALSFEPQLPLPAFRGEPALPLFASDDEPMIKVPSAPRPPLAVRRTPETPRLRAVPRAVERPVPQPEPEPVLAFADEPEPPAPAARAPLAPLATAAPVARLAAAAVDHLMLGSIDVVIVYLTLRMAGLGMSDWANLPLLPMLAFLALIKLAYFTAFTAVGGQTIGKMTMGLRVVGEEQEPLAPAHALHRALAGALSFLTAGAGFVPALVSADRRAVHDRLAHTRVVALPSA